MICRSFLASFSVICAGFSPATVWPTARRRDIATILRRILHAEFFTFYNRVKETNPARKGGSRGNIFALSFKVTECHLPLRHHGVFYVILRGERIRKVSRRDDICILLGRYRKNGERIRLQGAEKARQKTDSGDERAGASFLRRGTKIQTEVYGGRRPVADRKSRVAVFSA